MNVRLVSPCNFMVPSQATLVLPRTGVVVLVGENGAGKSRFIEACAYAASGKTLRGATPWRASEAGSVVVESYDGWNIQRTVTAKGTKKTLVNGIKADTNTKTQDWIDIDLDLWRRTHVFSSADAAHFSTATDTERKDLIEQILGLSVFDQAVAACKQDQEKVRASLLRVQGELASVRALLNAAKDQLANWQDDAPFEEQPEPPRPCDEPNPELIEKTRSMLVNVKQAASEMRGLDVTPQAPPDLIEKRAACAEQFRAQKKRMVAIEAGKCSECGTAFAGFEPEAAREELENITKQGEAVRAAIDEFVRQAERRRAQARAQLAAIEESRDKLGSELHRLEHEQRLYATWQKQRADWAERQAKRREQYDIQVNARSKRKAELTAARDEYADQTAETEAAAAELERDALELGTTRDALKALRAIVLGRALGGIEAVANSWLGRVGQAALRLTPYTENKSGGTSDKIGLELVGYGGGEGYKAASGGERRRVDTALLLALAEVSGAAAGRNDGTLWLDEIFDALDSSARSLVAQALGDLGKTRCVVVITHAADLAQEVPAAARYHVKLGGELEKLL